MTRTVLTADNGPRAVGPYSQGILTDQFIFLSGQIPIDPAVGKLVEGDITAQTQQVLKNITTLLEAAGVSLRNVVKSTVFLTDLGNFAAMNAVYGTYFTEEPPARSTIQVAGLPMGAQVEIEVVALRSL